MASLSLSVTDGTPFTFNSVRAVTIARQEIEPKLLLAPAEPCFESKTESRQRPGAGEFVQS